jgi:predicted 2-oxoglutarate/Fe(II)-dependent dioxygenase YbiX
MKYLADYIHVFKNAAKDDLCEKIITEYKNSDDWRLGTMNQEYREDIRNCALIPISRNNVIEKNKVVRKEIDHELFSCVSSTINKYIDLHPDCIFRQDTGYDLLRYEVGQYIKRHIDVGITDAMMARQISCSIALNNEYEGGEFAFFDNKLSYKLEKGDILMFPSGFMYPHEVLPITSGTRYSIITWFN